MMKCVNCEKLLTDSDRFCSNCGTAVTIEKQKISSHNKDEKIILDAFYSILQQRIKEEQDIALFDKYVECFLAKEYNQRVLLVGAELQQKGYDLHAPATQIMLHKRLSYVVDVFIIRFCSELNVNAIPDEVLSYAAITQSQQIDLFQMILDFLYFQGEKEKVYFDFLKMSPKKLRKANQSFLHVEPTERIFFICDQSFLGSCKEGVAMTEKGLYWKHTLQPARQVLYADLKTIELGEDWLMINQLFFNINRGFNIKMARLLRKIQELQ